MHAARRAEVGDEGGAVRIDGGMADVGVPPVVERKERQRRRERPAASGCLCEGPERKEENNQGPAQSHRTDCRAAISSRVWAASRGGRRAERGARRAERGGGSAEGGAR